MKLNQITLENFGIYQRRSFDFSGAPLVIVYGANEAGKTTALNGIRQAIFGFRQRGLYDTSTNTVGEIDATLRNGSKLQFSRRKGRPDKISGTLNGLQLDDTELGKLLCNLDVESYESLFGFSQDELKAGQEALKNNHIAEALAGGGFGGIQALESLRTELSESLSELYKPRGKKAQLNVKLEEIGQARQKLNEVSVLPSEADESRRQLSIAKSQSHELQKRIEELQRSVFESRRRLEALPSFQARKAAQLQLDGISIPKGLDAQFVSQWRDAAEQRTSIQARLEKHQEQLIESESAIQVLRGNDNLLEHESQIESLGHQAEMILELRRNLESWQTQEAESTRVRDRLLAKLGLETSSEALSSFQVDGPTRSRMLELSQEVRSRKDRIVQCAAKKEAAEQAIAEWTAEESEQSPPENWQELQKLAEQLKGLESNCQQEASKLESLHDAPEFKRVEHFVQHALQDLHSINDQWDVLSDERICEFLQQQNELALTLKTVRSKVNNLEAQLRDRNLKAKNSSDTQDAHSLLAKANAFSRQRDAILAHWLDELSQPLIAASISLDQQQERLDELQRIGEASDQIRDDLLDLADQVAADNQAKNQTTELQKQLAESKLELKELEDQLAQRKDEWSALWAAIPLRSLDIDLRKWASEYRNWQSGHRRIQDARRSLQRYRSLLKASRLKILDVWPTNLRSGVNSEQLLPELKRWESATHLQAQQQQRLQSQHTTLKQVTTELESLQRAQAATRKEMIAWLETVPMSTPWPEEQIPQLLDTLDQLQRAEVEAHEKSFALQSGRAKLQQFCDSVAALAKNLDSEPSQASNVEPEIVASRWLRELTQVREEKTQRTRLGESIRNLKERIKEAQSQVDELDAKLATICSAAADSGSDAPADMQSLMSRIHRAEQLRSELTEHDAKLSAFFGGMDQTDYLRLLDELDPTEINLQIRESESQITELENERKKLHELIGQHNERLDRFAKGTETQRIRQEIQNRRGELVELTEKWIVQRLAQELLNRAVELYGEENEPELLKYSKEYLDVLTGGRYPIIEHDKSSKLQFSVRNRDGVQLSPDQLSTGTREQLYLAIRMAYITQHSLHREPLPVIMDDCFVNFDDARTRSTLDAIRGFDDDIQTIVLSCHTRIPQLAAELAPDTPIIELQSGRTVPAELFSSLSLV